MKIFLFKIVIYSISIITICFIVQYFVDKGFRKYNVGEYAVWNKIFAGKVASDIVIIGSSRAAHQFNPKILEDSTDFTCFNLGVDGGGFITIKSRWESYKANNKSPKILIFNFDMMYFRRREVITNKMKYLPYLSEHAVSSNLERIDNMIWFEKNIPLLKYCGLSDQIFLGLKSYIGLFSEVKNKLYNGYWADPRSWDQDFVKFKAKNKKIIFSEENIDDSFDHIIELNEEFKKKKIKLILVHAPMYYELQKLMPQMDSLMLVMKQLASNNSFLFWDYSKDSLSFSRTYFHNSMHLNRKGANLFTQQLASDLEKYIIISGIN